MFNKEVSKILQIDYSKKNRNLNKNIVNKVDAQAHLVPLL